MRIMLVSDAWFPQTNGVVTTLAHTAAWLTRFGHRVRVIEPREFPSVPCPTYPEIRLALVAQRQLAAKVRVFAPDALHIATEGPLGLAARRLCLRQRWRFTTSYHTQFPQYLAARFRIPVGLSYRALCAFHRAASRCLVSTPSLRRELAARGFRNLAHWARGVDPAVFKPEPRAPLPGRRPIAAYVGRIAVEKNVREFLDMPWEGSKILIGDGPERAALQAAYPSATFLGYRYGAELAAHIAAADVVVFPSRTDTFGLVLLEAMACGVPVAAHPATGPIDVLDDGVTGALDEDLARAARRALTIDRRACRARALQWSWEACTRQFEQNLVDLQPATRRSRRAELDVAMPVDRAPACTD